MAERAERKNQGKAPLHYILNWPRAVTGVAHVARVGAQKYARFNYKKGAMASESVDSLLRHLTAWLSGEDFDPELEQNYGEKVHHLHLLAWNALRLADELTGPMAADLDDRYRPAATPVEPPMQEPNLIVKNGFVVGPIHDPKIGTPERPHPDSVTYQRRNWKQAGIDEDPYTGG